MKTVLLVGGTGFIGTSLTKLLLEKGFFVVLLTRKCPLQYRQMVHPNLKVKSYLDFFKKKIDDVFDDPQVPTIDIVINLAGSSIGKRRWSESVKAHILKSRLTVVSQLIGFFKEYERWPQQWINASAIGFYGDRGAETLTEESHSGTGFLSDVCQQWEAALLALPKQVSLSVARFGLVLGKKAPSLRKMKVPFYLHMGGCMGDKEGMMSWISVQDCARALVFVLEKNITGPVNVVSPFAVNRRDFFDTLASVMRTKSWLHISDYWLQKLLGDMSQMLTDSQLVEPAVLKQHGFEFHDRLDEVL